MKVVGCKVVKVDKGVGKLINVYRVTEEGEFLTKAFMIWKDKSHSVSSCTADGKILRFHLRK